MIRVSTLGSRICGAWIILENETLLARFVEQLGPDYILSARLICY